MRWALLHRERGKVSGVLRWIEQARTLGQSHGFALRALALPVEYMNVNRGQSEPQQSRCAQGVTTLSGVLQDVDPDLIWQWP